VSLRAWLTGALALCLSAPAVASDADATETCHVTARTGSGTIMMPLPSLQVLRATSVEGPFELPADAPAGVSAVICARDSIVPAANDWKVLAAGYPFRLEAPGGRGLWLEMTQGQLQVGFSKGALSEPEMEQVQAFLDEAQRRLQDGDGDETAPDAMSGRLIRDEVVPFDAAEVAAAKQLGVQLGAPYARVASGLRERGWQVVDPDLEAGDPNSAGTPERPGLVCGAGYDAICSATWKRESQCLSLSVNPRTEAWSVESAGLEPAGCSTAGSVDGSEQ
jgi:hypothetical protein